MAKSTIKDKVITTVAGAATIAIIGGITLYFSSFAKDLDVKANTKKIEKVETKVEGFQIQIKNTQNMICAMAITLVDDREKAVKICEKGGN